MDEDKNKINGEEGNEKKDLPTEEKKDSASKGIVDFLKGAAEKTPSEEKKEPNPSGAAEGNVFSQVFNKSAEKSEKDLISTIISTAQKDKSRQEGGEKVRTNILGESFSRGVKKGAKISPLQQKEERKKKKLTDRMRMAKFALLCSLLVPLASWFFFQTTLNPESQFAETLNAQNFGAELVKKQETVVERRERLAFAEKEIQRIAREKENIANNNVLSEIKDNRIDFLDLMLKIYGIALESMRLSEETNEALGYLKFHNYSARSDKDGTQISFSGIVRDPQKKSLSRLTRLMEAINENPYFSGAELRSFVKTDDDENGSQSNFSFNFSYLAESE